MVRVRAVDAVGSWNSRTSLETIFGAVIVGIEFRNSSLLSGIEVGLDFHIPFKYIVRNDRISQFIFT